MVTKNFVVIYSTAEPDAEIRHCAGIFWTKKFAEEFARENCRIDSHGEYAEVVEVKTSFNKRKRNATNPR